MLIKTNLKKIGASYQILIPSAILKVYNLLSFTDDYEYAITVENEGKRIILNRVKKKDTETQTSLDKFEEKKK